MDGHELVPSGSAPEVLEEESDNGSKGSDVAPELTEIERQWLHKSLERPGSIRRPRV